MARTLELLEELDALEAGAYDVVVFDVLGDVVCGGFAAPLRRGFAEKVVIVVSEEPMAMFAANNIARAINTYQRNGVKLAGFVANLKSEQADVGLLERFAASVSTRLLAIIPRDPSILAAERHGQTVIEHAPESPAALALRSLADALGPQPAAQVAQPTPLNDDDFFAFLRDPP